MLLPRIIKKLMKANFFMLDNFVFPTRIIPKIIPIMEPLNHTLFHYLAISLMK